MAEHELETSAHLRWSRFLHAPSICRLLPYRRRTGDSSTWRDERATSIRPRRPPRGSVHPEPHPAGGGPWSTAHDRRGPPERPRRASILWYGCGFPRTFATTAERMSRMIVIGGKAAVRHERRDEVVRAALAMAEATRKEEGSMANEFSSTLADYTILIFEEWASDEALARHFQAERMPGYPPPART